MKTPFSVDDLMNAAKAAEFVRLARQRSPHLFERFALPKYNTPGGYRSYTHLTEMLALNEIDLTYRYEAFGVDAVASIAALVSSAAWKQKQYDFPLAYVGRDIADAASKTELPEWMDFSEIRWPLPAITFMLPQGQFISPLGNDASALSICHVSGEETRELLRQWKAGERKDIPARLITSQPRIESGSIFVWATLMTPAGLWKMWGLDRPLSGLISESVFQYAKIGDVVEGHEEEEDLDNQWWHRSMLTLAFNLIMLMAERPELVEPSRRLKMIKSKKSGGAPQTLWEPRWVGRNYRYAREAGAVLEGHHASPRTHWRVGHWRQQAHGPKHSLHRPVWIEPILVNAP